MTANNTYQRDQILGLYELGRLYYEMGIFPSAEKIFAGLIAVQAPFVPCHVGLGLVKLERGQYEEADYWFREALKNKDFELEAKFGLTLVFLATNELGRAKVLMNQMEPFFSSQKNSDPILQNLREALFLRLE